MERALTLTLTLTLALTLTLTLTSAQVASCAFSRISWICLNCWEQTGVVMVVSGWGWWWECWRWVVVVVVGGPTHYRPSLRV